MILLGMPNILTMRGMILFEQKKTVTRKPTEEVTKEELLDEKIPEQIVRQFVTIPLGQAPDEWVERKYIEFGSEGEKVDAREYKDKFAEEVKNWLIRTIL